MNLIQELFNRTQEESNYLTELKDPFVKDAVDCIRFRIYKSYKGIICYSASIDFVHGNTSGKHEIEANGFVELVQKVESLVNNLPK